MGTQIQKVLDWTMGANTTALAVTSQPVFQDFAEANIDRIAAQRRLGKVGIYQFPVTATILDADGTDDTVTWSMDARIFPLGLRFSFKTLFVVDSIASDRFIVGKSSATAAGILIKLATTGTLTVTLTDSAAATTTLTWTGITAGLTCALLVARDGATVTGSCNNVTASGTMSATLSLASGGQRYYSDNGSNFLDGAIDYFTILSTYETSQRDGWCRTMFPRAENVLLDHLMTIDANGFMLDRGQYEAHATSAGSPSDSRTPLCLNPDPVLAVGTTLDTSNQRQFAILVGNRVYPSRLA